MGNQDSSGANNPFVIQSANGELIFNNGNSWATTGGTLTPFAKFSRTGTSYISNAGNGIPALTLNTSGTNNYADGLRINPNTNTAGTSDYAAISFAAVADSASGTWYLGKLNTTNYSQAFALLKNGFTGSAAIRADAAFDVNYSTGRTTFGYNPYVGSNQIWHAGNLTNVNQLSNGPGFISGGGAATFQYVLTTGGGLADNSAALRVFAPGGAGYATSTSAVTGAIKIRLPQYRTSTMMRMTIKIYEYNGTTASSSRSIDLGGYNNSAGGWLNTFATQVTHGGGDLNVRFGHDGTYNCIWIGETSTVWAYPQVFVTDFQAGYNGYTNTQWINNWTITFVTTFNTVETGPVAIARAHTTYSLTNLSQLTNGPSFVSAYYTSPTDFRGGSHMFMSSGTGQSTIGSGSYAIQVGPAYQRITTAGSYYGGIAFNHLLNYGGGTLNSDSTSYNVAPHAWIGLRLYDATGSERSYLVFATKSGTGTTGTGTDLPVERMNIDPINGYVGINQTVPTARLHVNGDSRFQGDSRIYIGPNSGYSADLILGGNGRTDSSKATVATTNGNLHLDAANGYDIYLNYYNGRDTYTYSSYKFWHSGNLSNLSQLTNGPGFITSSGSAGSLSGVILERFVYGTNGNKTTNRATGSNWNVALPSGFYDAYQGTGAPTSDWWHALVLRHNNTANDYQLQVMHNFYQDANVQFRTVNGGSYGAWRASWNTGGTNGLTNLSQLTNGPAFLGKNGNTYYQADNRIQFLGTYGIYSATNSAHIYPNDGTYGSWKVAGTRNGWAGLEFPDTGTTLMMNSNETGHYRIGYGWQFRWYNGNFYIDTAAQGGGSEYIAWHQGNLTNLSQLTNGPGYVTATTGAFNGITMTSGGISNVAWLSYASSSYNAAVMMGNWNGPGYWGFGTDGTHTIKIDQVGALGGGTQAFAGASDIVLKLGTKTVWDTSNLTNVSQLSNGPGYLTPTSQGDINFASSTNGNTGYSYASLELRESNFGGSTYTAPRLSFHWSGVVASQIGVQSNGRITIYNNPGSGLESFEASSLYGVNFLYNANTAYGVKTTSGYFDTVNSGSNGDPIELVYYTNSSDVRIGTGGNGNRNLYAGALYDTGSRVLSQRGNSYYQVDVWLQVNGTHGLYWPASYNPSAYGHYHQFWTNSDNSYGSSSLYGYRNGYAGINMHSCSPRTVVGMYDTGGNGGDWNPSSGWMFYWLVSQACLGLGGSSTASGYRARTNGSHYVDGTVYATSEVYAYSDRRKKKDIVTVDNALNKVLQLRGVYYKRTDNPVMNNEEWDPNQQHIGVIAQEVEPILPEVVTYNKEQDEYGVSYGNFSGLFIEAFKDMKAEIDALKAEIKLLKGEE